MDNKTQVCAERHGATLVISIDRPQLKNAMGTQASEEMTAALDLLDQDPALTIGIITGNGGNFCTGADLKAAARGERPLTASRGGFGIVQKPPRKPLIAAVEGYAIGGGLEICLACDLVVAARDAKFGLPEVRSGVMAIGGGLFRLPKRVPRAFAMEVILGGQFYDASTFHQHGVVNRLTEPGQALQEATKWATALLDNAPLAMLCSKEIVDLSAQLPDEEAWRRQEPIVRRVLESRDRAEGLAAFAEKRKPRWSGQ
ncbi:MAG TPA: crotonase/enoyl-CoA hydratase family protein [Burkholderiaceae bacterium]|nr:crotonase/enoyl-CoA hydratase family protein [Burkholderiaceae bacterium]